MSYEIVRIFRFTFFNILILGTILCHYYSCYVNGQTETITATEEPREKDTICDRCFRDDSLHCQVTYEQHETCRFGPDTVQFALVENQTLWIQPERTCPPLVMPRLSKPPTRGQDENSTHMPEDYPKDRVPVLSRSPSDSGAPSCRAGTATLLMSVTVSALLVLK